LTYSRNFIFDEKYQEKDPGKYQRFGSGSSLAQPRGEGSEHPRRHRLEEFGDRFNRGVRHFMGEEAESREGYEGENRGDNDNSPGRVDIQLCRR
jgi:hypothetical protein